MSKQLNNRVSSKTESKKEILDGETFNPITDIKYSTEAPTSVYQLSCEPYDWFFVSGLLIHNK